MPGKTSNSLVDLSNLSKVGDTLVKKASDAVGGLFAPWQIKRIAEAEAAAALTKAQSDIEITDLQRRAMHRFVEEEARHQQNMEEIIGGALPDLNEGASPDSMEDDWVANFFDKARIVTDSQMQGLWSRVLSGEANLPGTYSKRTVNLLSDLDKRDAELFTKLCGFGVVINGTSPMVPLVLDTNGTIYNRYGIVFSALVHLDSIGLIKFSGTRARRTKLQKRITVLYYGEPLHLEMPKDAGNWLDTGHVVLTQVGVELAPLCGSKPVDGFRDYLKEKWKTYLLEPEIE